ncbi:relaxase domain-containing protein [Acidiferrobacter thiooxydans]|uniref:MobF family relaxase n=1 Tax=Acidiferrobacter thiooxydans TaxID=163359 RepID=UPI000826490C|nr:MobF family relaxase [Acidiferrobacter thiooxydans]UEO00470.1 relaxase domain-containing protein [Acidiferrobacter thiooxydans]
MMTVKSLKSVKQARSYYSAEKGIASYYSSEANAYGGGQWYGHGADALGLRGPIHEKQWNAALEGRFGKGQAAFQVGSADPEKRRPGADLTFSAPKSVSIVALTCGDDRLIGAHDRAVERALACVEQNHVFARMKKGGTEKVLTGNLTAALYRHVTARPVNGVTDPQLHTHAVCLNITKRPDGQWVSVNLGLDKDWIKAGGTIYRAELAREIRSLGYEIVQTRDGFEIKGVSREIIERFSGRSGQIVDELTRRGKTRASASATEKDGINLKTRQGKEQKDGADLRGEWCARAESAGLTRESVVAQARGPVTPPDAVTIKTSATEAVQSAIRHLAERESAFSHSAILGAAVGFGLGQVGLHDLQHAVAREIAAGHLVVAKGDRFTTKDAITREQVFVARIREGRDAASPIMLKAPTVLETADGKTLNASQAAAARHILEAPDKYVAVQGVAGAGKTTAMQAVREQAEAAGYQVVGLAPTHRAAKELRDAGISDTYTSARVIAQMPQGVGPNTLFIVDESSMISAADMAALVERIEASGARAAFVGDTRQLQAVEAGSPFRQMQDHAQTAVMDEIQRQRNAELKEAVAAFASGDAVRAAELSQAFMVEVKPEQIATAAARDFVDLSPEARAEALVITGTNTMRREINEHIRGGLQEKGELSRDERSAEVLHKIDLTREQVRHVNSYEPGQVIEFRRDYQSQGVSQPVERGHQYEIAGVNHETKTITLWDRENGGHIEWSPKVAQKVTVSERGEIALADGDRVVFKTNDNERGIINGDKGTVIQSQDGITVATDRGEIIDLRGAEHVDYAYCQTVHASQGATCNHVILAAPSESMTATAEQGYVGLSRAREEAVVYTDDKSALAERWSNTNEKENAMEVRLDTPAREVEPERTRETPTRETQSPDLGRSR